MAESRDEDIYEAVCHIHRTHPLTSRSHQHVTATCRARRSEIDVLFSASDENSLARIYDQQMFQRELNDLPQEIASDASQLPSEPILKGLRVREETWVPVTTDGQLSGYSTARPLNKGRYADVWLCKSHYSQETVVKYLHSRGSSKDSQLVGSALAESQALFGFSHRNVIRIFESGYLSGPETTPVPYIAMEYVDGDTLLKWRQRTSVSDSEALRILDVLCDALSACHAAGVYHMDLSPTNVLIARTGTRAADAETIKLIDFGAAAINFVDLRLSTRPYTSPDRSDQDHQPNAQDDVFALGCILYFVVTGEEPSLDDNRHPCFDEQNIRDPLLRAIWKVAVATDRAKRYQTVEEFRSDLQAWVDGYPVSQRVRTYTWWEEQLLLVARCRKGNDVSDHSRLIAYAYLAMAPPAIGFAILSYLATRRGVEPNHATWTASSCYIAWILGVQGMLAWLTRFRHTTQRMLKYLLTFIIAFWMCGIVVSKGELWRGAAFEWILTAVAAVYMGLSTPEWRWWNWLGWVLLVLGIPVGYMCRQPWFPAVYPMVVGSEQGALFLVFAGQFFWESKNARTAEKRKDTVVGLEEDEVGAPAFK
jgi:Protein kinase domain